MKRRSSLVGLMALAMTASVAPPQQSDEAQIRALLESKYSRQNSCDFSYVGTYATKDATEFLPNYVAPQLKDSPQSVADLKALCAAGGRTNLNITIQGLHIFGGDTAIIFGIGHFVRIERDGTRRFDSDFNWTDVLLKTKEGWRVRHTHVGPIIPGVPTIPANR